jgi:DNA-binding transcriptional ArsR family regulator
MSRNAAAVKLPDTIDLRALGRFLVALGDPTRQEIVMVLCCQRLNVGQLSERFPLSRPAMSHHLKVLADAGLLVRERNGRERVYRFDARRARELADHLRQFIGRCASGAECCT